MLSKLKKIIAQHRTREDAVSEETHDEQVRAHPGTLRADREPVYFSDQPIKSKSQDRLHRWPFAHRIAETLAERTDPSSLVMGIYGQWGDGKSSTLYLMEERLAQYPDVIRVRFNPWHFESEDQLVRGFFATLGDAVGKSVSTKGEEIGRILKKYGSILSLASLNIAGAIQLGVGDAAKGLGEALSNVTLDELRSRLDALLHEQGRRIVIVIDDIDRLDRREIQAIFRLIKLSASFDYTSYVLAFDDKMVAASLGERYGGGNEESGRAFLEKIVQVPLHLPPADQISLRRVTFEDVDSTLRLRSIELSEEQAEAFIRRFVDGIEPRLTTPRQAKLFINVLQFALPILKGEVHPVDQMLIEGIRVFYPKLYATIRDNPDYFLKDGHESGRDERFKARADELIALGLEGIGVIDKEQVRRGLLDALFPRLGKMGYGPEWDERWHRQQRICAAGYFKRFFNYGVPPGDVPDFTVTRLLEIAASENATEIDRLLAEVGRADGMSTLISKLRLREDAVEPMAASRLALALCRNGTLLPREKQMFISDWTFLQAAILITKLVSRLPDGEERSDLVRRVIRESEPLSFAFECLRWLKKDENQPETERVIPAELEDELGQVLAGRVRAQAAREPLYRSHGSDAPRLFWIWKKHAPSGEVEAYLRRLFEDNSAEIDDFLATYVGRAWGLESGLSHIADFERNNFNSVAELISPDFVLTKLKKRYGSELDDAQYRQSGDVPIARRIAHQFASVFQGIKKEPEKTLESIGK